MLDARVRLLVALTAYYNKTCGLSNLYLKALRTKVKLWCPQNPDTNWHKLQSCLCQQI